MSEWSDIVAEAEGTDQEWRRRRITRKLGLVSRLMWEWSCRVIVRRGRGKDPGGCERPGSSPSVTAINILLLSNGDKLDYLRDYIFTGPDSVPSEVNWAWNQELTSATQFSSTRTMPILDDDVVRMCPSDLIG